MHSVLTKVCALGAFRASAAYHVWGLPLLQVDDQGIWHVKELFEERMGVQVLLHSLGLHVDGDPVVNHPIDHDDLVETLFKNCCDKDQLDTLIRDAYGRDAQLQFKWAQLFSTSYILASVFGNLTLRGAVKGRKKLIKAQRSSAAELLTTVGQLLDESADRVARVFDPKIVVLARELALQVKRLRLSPASFLGVARCVEPIVNHLVPAWSTMAQRLQRAMELRLQLVRLPPGEKFWRNYEEICTKILRFLFLPPFRTVMTQTRSADGHERRDAILPNNSYEGFWAALRAEFDSRHIICEFKNTVSSADKEDLQQLRIYLSKPTIGRFGLMFVRKPPKESLKRAQREAYEQHKILILILDDSRVVDLMYFRCFLGGAEEVLEREKVLFEVEY
jgi:hypothetical protein